MKVGETCMVSGTKLRWKALVLCGATAFALGACKDSGDNDGDGNSTCDPSVEECDDECTAPEVMIDGECCLDTDGDGECDEEGTDTSDDCLGDEVLIHGNCCVDANDNGICDTDENGENDCDEGESLIDGECCEDQDNDGICDEDMEQVDRLLELQELPADVDCENGGQVLVSGLDSNEDGSLSEDEIDTRNRLCILGVRAELEHLDVGDATCAHGGYELTVGEDDGADGIEDNDNKRSAVVCKTDEDSCVGSSGLQYHYARIEKDPFQAPYRTETDYPVEMVFSRNVDGETAVVLQSPDGFVPDADFDDVVSWDDARTVHASIRRDTVDAFNALALVADACGAAVVPVMAPQQPTDTPARIALDGPIGVFEEGDDYEVCWEVDALVDFTLRLEASDESNNYDVLVDDIDESGCETIVLGEAQVANNRVMRVRVAAYDSNDDLVMQGALNRPQQYSVYATYAGAPGDDLLPSWAGFTLVNIVGDRLEKCVVWAGEGPSVTVTDLSQSVPVQVDEGSFVQLECRADDGSTVRGLSQTPFPVGAGFSGFNVNAYTTAEEDDFGWSITVDTFGVDGSCEAEFVVDDTVTVQVDSFDLEYASTMHWTYNDSDEVVDGLKDHPDLDLTQVSASITCTDSNDTTYSISR